MGKRGKKSRFATPEEKREAQRQAGAAWLAAHPGYARAWRAAHRPAMRRYSAKFRAANPTYGKTWRRQNPGYHKGLTNPCGDCGARVKLAVPPGGKVLCAECLPGGPFVVTVIEAQAPVASGILAGIDAALEDAAPDFAPGIPLSRAVVKAGYAHGYNLRLEGVREHLAARLTADGWIENAGGWHKPEMEGRSGPDA